MIVTKVEELPQLVPDTIGEVITQILKPLQQGNKKILSAGNQQTMRTQIKTEKQKYFLVGIGEYPFNFNKLRPQRIE